VSNSAGRVDHHDKETARMTFLELTGIRKQFAGGVVAVEHFDLAAARGEFVSFLGPSGCGKTTTLRMIAGFEPPTAGTIRIDGKDVTNTPPNKRHVGMVFQSYALFPNMSVADNIAFGLKIRGESGDKIKGRVAELLRLIHLEDRGDRYPYQLSGGQQQRVALARALAIEPTVLLLDEPLSALDAKIRVALRQEIRQIQRQLGITTVYVTHDQEEALELSDRIVVMSDGRVEQIGTPFEIYNFPATGFVASFVGTLNAVEAKVVDPAAGRLALGGHAIRTTSALDGAVGDAVMVALRPEMITLDGIDGQPVDGANRVPATVTDVAFLGSVVRVSTKVGDGTTVHVDTFNNPNLAVPPAGSPVTLSFPPEACLVLARDAVVQDSDALAAAEAML
jgi:putative spermidine/putrescine transport system ATP-binding protein